MSQHNIAARKEKVKAIVRGSRGREIYIEAKKYINRPCWLTSASQGGDFLA